MTEETFVPAGIAPSAEQLAVQLARVPYGLVEANAGAAKTTTLALRIAQALQRGAAPERILALTYTATAVQALRDALLRIGLASSTVARLQIHGFDAFCAERLAQIEGGGVTRCRTPEQIKPYVLRAIERAQTLPEERYPDELVIPGGGEGMVEGLLSQFALLKGTLRLVLDAPEQRMSPALADELGHDYASLRVYSAFEFIRRGGHPDHPAFRAAGDATYDLARLIVDDELAGSEPHPLDLGLNLVVLDEMHDTNRAMFTVLACLLASNRRVAFLGVGDRDQVIHSAAGADADFMGAAFERGIGRAARFPLTTSFRFGAALADAAGRLAAKPYRSGAVWPTEIKLLPFADTAAMSRHVARSLQELRAAERVSKAPGASIAVLIRQAHQSIPLEDQLLRAGVHYRTAGFTPYLQRREVLLVRGLHAYAQNDFSGFDAAPARVAVLQALMLFAGSYIDSQELRLADRVDEQQRVMREVAADPAAMPLFIENQILRNADAEVRRRLLDAIDLLRSDDAQAFARRFVAVLQPHQLAARVLVCREDIDQLEQNVAQLVGLVESEGTLEALFRVMHEQAMRQRQLEGRNAVILASIEAAKGLEFDHVILPGLNQGDFAVGGHSTENRNLLYVGMTRARRHLAVLFDAQRPSRYLFEAGLLPPVAGP
ncbi:MAG: ATP-dependent helicase [Burkholderiaceae bacterium]|nr:ATP-dependent helicase [Burkholderiaceae bacterium]